MLNLNLVVEDIEVKDVNKNDITKIYNSITKEKLLVGNKDYMNIEEVYDRFLEYYLTEGEFFVKFECENEFIGFLRGRVEFKKSNKVWINCIHINKEYRNKGIGSKLIIKIIEFLKETYDIKVFYTGILNEEKDDLRFWKRNGFYIERISKEFFDINEKKKDMLILFKQ